MTKRRKAPLASEVVPLDPFAELYPHIATWLNDGWIEIGRDDFSRSFVRALDIGGMAWEGKSSYPSVHAALTDLDNGIAKWLIKH